VQVRGQRAPDPRLVAALAGGGVAGDGAAQLLRRRIRLPLGGEDRAAGLRAAVGLGQTP